MTKTKRDNDTGFPGEQPQIPTTNQSLLKNRLEALSEICDYSLIILAPPICNFVLFYHVDSGFASVSVITGR
jgi:hypothetical protein